MSTTTTRKTVAGAYAEIGALRTEMSDGFAVLLAAIEGTQPAKTVTRKPKARKAAPKRTAQPKADLGRKGWNKALSGLARSKGSTGGVSVYSQVIAQWDRAQALRDAGKTPAQALKALGF